MIVGLVITAIVLVYFMIISPGFGAVVIVLLIGVVALVRQHFDGRPASGLARLGAEPRRVHG
jgi:hypothetical protein